MQLAPADFTYLADLVHRESAIVLEPGKEYLAESRLLPLVHQNGLQNLAELVGRLRSPTGAALRAAVVEAMTTNETSWFRDAHPFDALRDVVIPDLIERRRNRRTLHIWCAASSSGQEPYSVAMLLREHFPELANWAIRILATDIAPAMVERTRAGWYSELEVKRGLAPELLERWFDPEPGTYVVKHDLRRLVDSRRLNLAGPWPTLPPLDLVLLRNVLIYFDLDTKRHVLSGVHRVLRPDGYLFLGGAETTMNVHDGFERLLLGRSVCHRPREDRP